jgi:polyadenylate-binding protein
MSAAPQTAAQTNGAPAASAPATAAAPAQQAGAAPATAAGAAPAAGQVAGAGAGSYASASLYVGDLAPDVTEALLFELFNAVGPVASVRVCRDAATRRSLGYAYVNFHRVDDAERALNTMNFKQIRNRPCRIMWSHRDPSLRKSGSGNIFINHLARQIDNKQLYDTFSIFGNILSCKVSVNAKRESLGYGFVHFETEEAARNAIERVDGKVIAGEKVSVSMFQSKKERNGGASAKQFTNVFVKNLPGEATKADVDAFFSKFGTITSSMVSPTKDDATKAYGFVNFAAPEEASAAIEGAHGQEFQGRKLFVSRAQKKEEREKELRDRFEQLKQERQKKYAGVNLYVKNLSDETDDEKLSQEFSKFGAITSAKVMRDAAGKSKGFGFVCFQSPEEATKAVTAMNGCMLDSKPLYVALAQRKEQRRAQLEAQYAARAKLGMPQAVQGMPAMGPYGAQNPNAMMMFAAGGMQQRGGQFGMYPGQQVAGMQPRWNPQAGAPMMMVNQPMRPGQMNYQLMPVQAGRPGVGMPGVQGPGPNVGGQNRGPRQNNRAQQGLPGQQQMGGPKVMGMPGQMGPGQQQQALRYAENVRNVRGGAPQMPMGGMPQGPMGGPQGPQMAGEVVMPAPHEPLTIKALAAAPEDMRKQMIGERLFPLIKVEQPNLAGKITGMLLEMDNGELIHLLESQQALHEKINEAMQVLQAHPEGAEQHEEDGDKQ